MHFYPHHIGDYRSAIAHLSNEEDLAYRRLLDMYYDTESPIPLDTQWVSRRIRVAPATVLAVLKDFFTETPDGWRSARCDREIEAYRDRANRARNNGKKGGRKPTKEQPTDNPVGSQSAPDGIPEQTGSQANQEPLTNNQEPKEKTARVRSPAVGKPDGVTDQTWTDWLQLRKAKKAPVSETVLAGALAEAQKAGLTLERFLQVWCTRGSQGLQADWLKPHERGVPARASAHSGFENRDYSNGDMA